jgi:hypothetical protein
MKKLALFLYQYSEPEMQSQLTNVTFHVQSPTKPSGSGEGGEKNWEYEMSEMPEDHPPTQDWQNQGG